MPVDRTDIVNLAMDLLDKVDESVAENDDVRIIRGLMVIEYQWQPAEDETTGKAEVIWGRVPHWDMGCDTYLPMCVLTRAMAGAN